MKNDIPTDLLKKYLEGKCTPDEIRQVDEWYRSFDGEPDLLSAMNPDERAQWKAHSLNKVLDELALKNEVPIREMPNRYNRFYRIAGIAAACLILIFGVYWYQGHNGRNEPTIVQHLPTEKHFYNSTSIIQRQQLPDGTRIWLYPHSGIRYTDVFNKELREISLKGEAFFEVSRDTTRPFIIHSGVITTRVLGTSFKIKAYDENAEVSVLTGKVTVKLNRPQVKADGATEGPSQVVLLPNQKVSYLDKKLVPEKAAVEQEPQLKIWKKYNVSFANDPVTEVAKVLEEKFGVQLLLDDKIASYRLTADFSEMNLADILQILEKSLNITYEIQGENIQIYPYGNTKP